MGRKALVLIHAEPAIRWHLPWAQAFIAGLRRMGVEASTTTSRHRESDVAVLLGTTYWKALEDDGGQFLLVDRCQYGDPEKWVTLGWNRRGRAAEFHAKTTAKRWRQHSVELKPWQTGRDVVLCGEMPEPPDLLQVAKACTHYRGHPARPQNDTPLPTKRGWDNVGQAVTWRSSVAVQAVMDGIPTVTLNQRNMAWDVSSHAVGEHWTGDRTKWCHWLAWCQWSFDEIKEGIPHLWDSHL